MVLMNALLGLLQAIAGLFDLADQTTDTYKKHGLLGCFFVVMLVATVIGFIFGLIWWLE